MTIIFSFFSLLFLLFLLKEKVSKKFKAALTAPRRQPASAQQQSLQSVSVFKLD
jgi:hypothetical protein